MITHMVVFMPKTEFGYFVAHDQPVDPKSSIRVVACGSREACHAACRLMRMRAERNVIHE